MNGKEITDTARPTQEISFTVLICKNNMAMYRKRESIFYNVARRIGEWSPYDMRPAGTTHPQAAGRVS